MAVDMFLKLDGIKGESTDHKHAGEIELLSFSWGVSNPAVSCRAGGGGGSGKPNFQDLSFMKRADSATAKLMLACATGEHIREGLITVRKAGDKPLEYLKIKLEDILISSSQSGGTEGSTPVESVSLNFTKFEINSNGDISSFDVCLVKND